MSLVRNRDWADDLVQETFIRAWSHLPTAGWLPSATWRRDRVLFYDGTLWLEEGSTELTTDRFTYLDGVATLLVEGELTIHEAVPPEVLAEKLAKVHNFGTIRGTRRRWVPCERVWTATRARWSTARQPRTRKRHRPESATSASWLCRRRR